MLFKERLRRAALHGVLLFLPLLFCAALCVPREVTRVTIHLALQSTGRVFDFRDSPFLTFFTGKKQSLQSEKNQTPQQTTLDEIFVIPKTKSQSFQLGILRAAWDNDVSNDQEKKNAILKEASTILMNQRNITQEDFLSIPLRIAEEEARKSVMARVRGIFTFVNFMWFVAILGICLSVLPFLHSILRPYFSGYFKKLYILLMKFILPAIRFLHKCHALEVSAYMFCGILVNEGNFRGGEIGFFISFTGLALSVPTYCYSVKLWEGTTHIIFFGKKKFILFGAMMVAFSSFYQAIFFESIILGFVTVIAVMAALSTSFLSKIAYYFASRHEMYYRVCASSALCLFLYFVARFTFLDGKSLDLFAPAVQIFGVIHMNFYGFIFLELDKPFSRNIVAYFFLLFSSIFVGMVFGMPSISNTCLSFLPIVAIERFLRLHKRYQFNIWVIIFFGSVALWRLALFLHKHPQFLVNCFSGKGL
eukprot:TRINITY_DN22801_c0_g1_i1.p2 TRINITY_DN22801_c0_g1~~TRINITY_DN22801_c0_g1_i1.p2  ORF type:complete len:476 (+),score=85.20 TRINITY_DN22801_c0_g1_i1:56-1483(+)